MANTTRWALPFPALDGSDSADVPFWMNALAVALDGVAMDDQGTLANRPVSTGGSPGKRGRYYMVKGDSIAANNGILWRDNGTGWDEVGTSTIIDTFANRPAASAVPSGTRFVASDQVAEWISNGTAWTRIGAQAGETAMTLAAAATAGKILLQGQAWPATTGIYTDLHALLGGSTLPDFRQRVPAGWKSGDTDMGTLLGVGGEKTHALTAAEMQHDHPLPETAYVPNSGVATFPAPKTLTGAAQDVTATGHNNLQPFVVVNFEAKL